MIDKHETAMKRLEAARQRYLEAIDAAVESLEAERAAVASPAPQPQSRRPTKRRSASGSHEPQVCAAAKPFLREEGPQSLAVVHKAIQSVSGLEEVSKGAVSAALSRSPEFFSDRRKWHLSEWRDAAQAATFEAPAPQPGLLPPSS
jgi:hypothetical protein